jgi:hypothetical protein
MGALIAVEMAIVAHACEDFAGRYIGGIFGFGRSDAIRYVAEGHLRPLSGRYDFATLCAAVAEFVDTHPEVLDRRLSDAEVDAQQARRDGDANAIDREALAAFKVGDFAAALDALDRAEVASPLLRDWESVRVMVRQRMEAESDGPVRSA